MVKDFQAFFFMVEAVKKHHQAERAKLLIEIYDTQERFELWKEKHPPGTDSSFQDKIDSMKLDLEELNKKYDIAMDHLAEKLHMERRQLI
jgi:hypothetical protein